MFELIRSKLLIFFLVLFGCRSIFVPPGEKQIELTKIYPAQFFKAMNYLICSNEIRLNWFFGIDYRNRVSKKKIVNVLLKKKEIEKNLKLSP